MFKKVFLAATAATMLFAVPSQAADYLGGETTIVPSWTGFYIGAGAGIGWVNFDAGGTYCDPFDICVGGNFIDDLVDELDTDSGVRGLVQAGLDWEIVPGFLVGVLGDYSFGQDLGYDESNNYIVDVYNLYDKATYTVQDMWTVAGRLGWATEETLFYGLAGWSWANTELGFKTYCFEDECLGDFSNGDQIDGWTLGLGVEFRGWFAENASTKLEYRYTDLSSKSASGFDDFGYFYKLDTDQDVQALYLTVNWRFNGL
jgi:outer membrane immunogenic protein